MPATRPPTRSRKPVISNFPLSIIKLDPAIDPRACRDRLIWHEYAELMQEGVKFPPVIGYLENADDRIYIADGFYRVEAAGLNTEWKGKITVELRPGGRRGALLHALQANNAQGCRRTGDDRRLCIRRALEDEELRKLSDTHIAQYCAVSRRLVSEVRAEVTAHLARGAQDARTVSRGGKTYTMDVGAIGRGASAPGGANGGSEGSGAGLEPADSRPSVHPPIRYTEENSQVARGGAGGDLGLVRQLKESCSSIGQLTSKIVRIQKLAPQMAYEERRELLEEVDLTISILQNIRPALIQEEQ